MYKEFSYKENLVIQLRNGQEEAFVFLMDTYYKKLCVYANTLCRDHYLAEDIVQSVFMKIWERRKNLKENYSIKSYLYQSVYNEFIDHYRQKNSLLNLEKEYFKTLKNNLIEEDNSEVDKLISLVKQEIENLPPKCRKVFILGKQEGLTYSEIADHLNISFRTVENQMSKAFEIIRKKVGEKLDLILILIFGNKRGLSTPL